LKPSHDRNLYSATIGGVLLSLLESVSFLTIYRAQWLA